MNNENLRTVMLAIQRKWGREIRDEHKTVEIRRRFLTEARRGDQVYLYETSPIKCVTSICDIVEVVRGMPDDIWRNHKDLVGSLTSYEFGAYLAGHDRRLPIVAIHLEYVRDLDFYVSREDLLRRGFRPPQSARYVTDEIREEIEALSELPF